MINNEETPPQFGYDGFQNEPEPSAPVPQSLPPGYANPIAPKPVMPQSFLLRSDRRAVRYFVISLVVFFAPVLSMILVLIPLLTYSPTAPVSSSVVPQVISAIISFGAYIAGIITTVYGIIQMRKVIKERTPLGFWITGLIFSGLMAIQAIFGIGLVVLSYLSSGFGF
jgi:hypothetical protein